MSCQYYRLFNPLNAELNPICHLLALLGVHHILHVSRIRVNLLYNMRARIHITKLLIMYFFQSVSAPCSQIL